MTRLNFLIRTFEWSGECPFCKETLALKVKGNILKFLVGVRVFQKSYGKHVDICKKADALKTVNEALKRVA